MSGKYLAYLRIRRLETGEVIKSIGLASLRSRYVAQVVSGITRSMDKSRFFLDESEVDAARAAIQKGNA